MIEVKNVRNCSPVCALKLRMPDCDEPCTGCEPNPVMEEDTEREMIFSLFKGMRPTMQEAVLKIMEVTQEEVQKDENCH